MSEASLNNGCTMMKQDGRKKPSRIKRGSSNFTAWNYTCTCMMKQGSNISSERCRVCEALEHHRQMPGDATRRQRRKISPVVSERQVKRGCASRSNLMPPRSTVKHCLKISFRNPVQFLAPLGQETGPPMRIIGETSVSI